MKTTACLKKIEQGRKRLERIKWLVNLLYISAVVVTFFGATILIPFFNWTTAYVVLITYLLIFSSIGSLYFYARQIKRDINATIPREKRRYIRIIIERWWSRQKRKLLKLKTQEACDITKKYMEAKTLVEPSDSQFS